MVSMEAASSHSESDPTCPYTLLGYGLWMAVAAAESKEQEQTSNCVKQIQMARHLEGCLWFRRMERGLCKRHKSFLKVTRTLTMTYNTLNVRGWVCSWGGAGSGK